MLKQHDICFDQVEMRLSRCRVDSRYPLHGESFFGKTVNQFLSHFVAPAANGRSERRMDSLYIRPETCHFFDCKRGNTAKRAFPTGVSGCGDSGDRVDEQNGHAIGCVDADVFARTISNHGVGFDRWRCFVSGDNVYAVDLPERFQL